MKKIIIIMKEDIEKYPPIMSLINVAFNESMNVVLFAGSKSISKQEELKKQGVNLYCNQSYSGNLIQRLTQLISFRNKAYAIIRKEYDEESVIWIVQSEMVALLGNKLRKYHTVGHFLEVREPKLSFGYRLLTLGNSYKKNIRSLDKVVCCEYNRAQITRWLFSLREVPVVLPNKAVWNESEINENAYTKEVVNKYKGKKIILYQGLVDSERHLDTFIESVNGLPEEYIFIIMGNKCPYSDMLKKKYENERVVFLDFITAPSHLCITRISHIGVLSYTPNKEEIGTVLNVLYCAPNKLYEYSRYGIPMISNDNPALKSTFERYRAGKSLTHETKEEIVKTILSIDNNYEAYSQESYKLYNSVNVEEIIRMTLGSI